MSKLTTEELNQAAMQIIMSAGNGRNLLTEAVNDTLSGATDLEVDEKLKLAKEQIVAAHRVQTDTIQCSIDDETLQTTLLFSHAQDTLMTIYSEQNTMGAMIQMYRKLLSKID
jgi:Phosphotransferase system cellobiose-specific component IIA